MLQQKKKKKKKKKKICILKTILLFLHVLKQKRRTVVHYENTLIQIHVYRNFHLQNRKFSDKKKIRYFFKFLFIFFNFGEAVLTSTHNSNFQQKHENIRIFILKLSVFGGKNFNIFE